MAVATLHNLLLSYKIRLNQINLELSNLQGRKKIATAQSAEEQSILSWNKAELRNKYKDMFASDEELQELYTDYTDIPDFEEDLDRILAESTVRLDEISDWEEAINAQITTLSTEEEEIKAYMESVKSMEQSNIQEDYRYGLGGG